VLQTEHPVEQVPTMTELEGVFLTIMLTIFLFLPVYVVYMVRRQREVYTYKNEVLGKMFLATIQDILAGKEDWDWRWDMYNSVGTNVMMRKWWKPLDEFYLDKSFMRSKK
jgi:hypothetical protein